MFKLSTLEQPIDSKSLEDMWAINQANIPEVGSIPTIEEFQKLTLLSSHIIVVQDDTEMAGFIILMREDQDYHSLNYQFLINKFDHFLYVDRVAIKDGFRRQGLGKKIYDEVFNIAKILSIDVCCEVNTAPRNDPSLAFHNQYGFKEVGEKDFGDHSVVYLKSPFQES